MSANTIPRLVHPPIDSEATKLTERLPLNRRQQAAELSPLLVDFAGLAQLLCRSVASLYRDRAAGRLGVEPVKLCGSVRFSVEEVRAWVAAGCPTRREWLALKAAQHNGRR